MQEVKIPLRVFVGMKRDKVGQGRSDVGTLIVRAVMGHDNDFVDSKGGCANLSTKSHDLPIQNCKGQNYCNDTI